MNLIEYSDVEITSLWNDYAETRNIGLKKIANIKLNKLIEYLESKSKDDKRKFVEYLCNERFEKENIKDFQQPIVEKIILPIIVDAVENDEMPYLRWIYQLQLYSCCNYRNIYNIEYYNSEDILTRANNIDPSDIKTVILLVKVYMDRLWFGSHHLPEYILIEDKEVKFLLEKLNLLLDKYKNKIDSIKFILEDMKYYKDLYKSWFKYKSENEKITFIKWCENNEKTYSWIKSYYYDKKNRT
ncbi:hypothetical protein [Clostridium frigidicarnis]|uniref:Uncharacterized protein n=1 Tax=Clostridium frigidicarnis TaxID=84698 RepID=A0A1I1A435_9CLOT|nr:hypothetical protein [Clostridium frigidicarnis]SFB31163.1 hypothetical protein SAMN04488528_10288 [Clostridium frigidicarnis]